MFCFTLLMTEVHSYYNLDSSQDEMKGVIIFLSPEYYPACLWIGKRIEKRSALLNSVC